MVHCYTHCLCLVMPFMSTNKPVPTQHSTEIIASPLTSRSRRPRACDISVTSQERKWPIRSRYATCPNISEQMPPSVVHPFRGITPNSPRVACPHSHYNVRKSDCMSFFVHIYPSLCSYSISMSARECDQGFAEQNAPRMLGWSPEPRSRQIGQLCMKIGNIRRQWPRTFFLTNRTKVSL